MKKRFYRHRTVTELTDLPRGTIYDLMARGEFPKNKVKLTEHRFAWLADEVDAWIADRIRNAEASRPRAARR